MTSATQDNKCENCQKVFQNIRLKRLPVCSHKVCSKCNPVLLRKQGKLKEDQLCPVCSKKPPVPFVRLKPRPKVTPRQGQATNQLATDNERRGVQADATQTAESDNCGHLEGDKEVEEEEEETDCAICTEVLKEPVTLPCEHQFCKECYEKWEERASTCPLCRIVVDEEKQRRLLEARDARRRQRRTRTTRTVQPPFPDPLFNTKPASAIATSLLMLPMFAMFTCGNFAVKHCHALMFTGFPFWTGIHVAIVVCLTFLSLGKQSSTVVIVQIVLSGFGIIFNTMSIFLASFQLNFTLDKEKIDRCEETDPEPILIVDIMLITAFVLADIILIIMIIISMVTLGANPGVCCLKRIFIPNSEATPQAFLHYSPGNFFPHEGHFTAITTYEKILNVIVFNISVILLAVAVVAFKYCHAFRSTGLFVWCPVVEAGFALFHMQHSLFNPTWCRVTTSMVMSSFATLISFVQVCFASAQLTLSFKGEILEGDCDLGPHPELDIVTVVGSVILVIANFLSTRAYSNHLVTPNRVEPDTA